MRLCTRLFVAGTVWGRKRAGRPNLCANSPLNRRHIVPILFYPLRLVLCPWEVEMQRSGLPHARVQPESDSSPEKNLQLQATGLGEQS